MSQISKEAYKKSDIETIDKGQYFWLSRRDLQINQVIVIGSIFGQMSSKERKIQI